MRTVDRDSSESTPLESGTFHVFSTDVDYSYLLGSKMGFRRQQLPRHTFYSVLTNSLTESMGWPNIKLCGTGRRVAFVERWPAWAINGHPLKVSDKVAARLRGQT
jgi:hypothetical protein